VYIVYKYDSKAKESSNSSSDSPPPKKTKYNNGIDNNLISDLDISPLSSSHRQISKVYIKSGFANSGNIGKIVILS